MTASLFACLLLSVVVLAILLYPIRQRPIDFDEKGEAIKVYRQEVSHIEQQHRKGLLDDNEKDLLLSELDRKSAMAMLAIEQRTFAYRRSAIPAMLLTAGLCFGGLLYAKLNQEQGVHQWHLSQEKYQADIIEGLFDRDVVLKNLMQSGENSRNYCFLLQKKMLSGYPDNPDALMNVAECHLQLGLADLAQPAIEHALRVNPEHLRANYVVAQLQFLQHQQLDKKNQAKLRQLAQTNPNAVDILYLLAVNSFSNGQFDEARGYLAKLRPHADNDPTLKQALAEMQGLIDHHSAGKMSSSNTVDNPHAPIAPQSQLADSADNSASKAQLTPPKSSNTASTLAPAATPMINAEDHSATQSDTKTSFSATIVIAPELRQGLRLPKTLFVIVKSPQGQLLTAGKYTLTDADKPLNVTLTDGQAGLMQMLPMAGFQQLQVTARISQTGATSASAGDLTTAPTLITLPQSQATTLTINQTVQ